MRSSELAELAGVTVRTLRHYHQIGLLDEPPRSSGGYREYGVGHLVRLLRITRMTALGVPLSVLPAVLDDPAAGEELLDALDRQAAADIERLTARRASIAALRRSGASPDSHPELSAWRSPASAELPEDMVRYEHEQLILLRHLLGYDGPAGLAALLGDASSDPDATASLTARFYSLDSDASDEEIGAVADELAAYSRPIVERMAERPTIGARESSLVEEFATQALRPAQLRVLRGLQQRLGRSREE